MFITLFMIAISIFMVFFAPPPLGFDTQYLMIIILVGGSIVFLGTVLLNTWILQPIGYLEQKLVPNVMQIVRQDKVLRIGRTVLFLFVLVSFFCVALVSRIQNPDYQDWFFIIWLILFGVALDVFRDSWKRLVNLLNPSFLVSRTENEAFSAIRNGQKQELFSNVDSLAEISLRAAEKSRIALSAQALQAFPPILKAYFDSSKSIGHVSSNANNQPTLQGGDESSYMIFYLLQRLEMIYDRALRERLESICRNMIMMMGKVIVICAKLDLSMVSFPVHFLTKFGLKAQQHHFEEVAVLTTGTLLEVSKTIIAEVDLEYADLKEPFQSILNGLLAIARATFKKQKETTSVKVIMQPLVDFKNLFQSEKIARHRDTPAIKQQIDNALEEFILLEQVMRTLPST